MNSSQLILHYTATNIKFANITVASVRITHSVRCFLIGQNATREKFVLGLFA